LSESDIVTDVIRVLKLPEDIEALLSLGSSPAYVERGPYLDQTATDLLAQFLPRGW